MAILDGSKAAFLPQNSSTNDEKAVPGANNRQQCVPAFTALLQVLGGRDGAWSFTLFIWFKVFIHYIESI